MGAAIGLWTAPGSPEPLGRLFGPALGADLYAIALFAAAWCILVGLHVERASQFLIALTVILSALAGSTGLHEILLALTLLPLAGVTASEKRCACHTGRIRLHRIPAPGRSNSAGPCPAPASHPFSLSPDDLACLFDQIGESRHEADSCTSATGLH